MCILLVIAQTIQKLIESIIYFSESSGIRTLTLRNFTESTIIKTIVWRKPLGDKHDFCHTSCSNSGINISPFYDYTTNLWTSLFPKAGWPVTFITTIFFLYLMQIVHYAASDLGPHCLSITLLEVIKILEDIRKLSLVGLECNVPFNTIRVTSSRSVYLTTLFLDKLSPLSG